MENWKGQPENPGLYNILQKTSPESGDISKLTRAHPSFPESRPPFVAQTEILPWWQFGKRLQPCFVKTSRAILWSIWEIVFEAAVLQKQH